MTNVLIRLFIKDYEKVNSDEVRRKYGLLSGIVGIICNTFLFVVKLLIGVITASVSVTADAFNNLSDAGSSIVTIVGFKMASRPADDSHPFGHGRIEYISGLIVSMAIILMGLEFIKSSIENIVDPDTISFSVMSVVLLLVSVVTKMWMFLFNMKISKKIKSYTMKASAMDSLSDVAITLTVIFSMLITRYTGLDVDGYAGILVSFFIIWTGVSTAKDTIDPLVGSSPNKSLVKKIEKKVLSYNGILGVHNICIHNYGPSKIVASLRVNVPSDIEIIEIHNVVDKIENDLKKEFNGEFLIHVDPVEVNKKICK